ncbi:MAG: MBL fold metallo-hydrolase [Pseudomonadota bacterium]|nr:MBL fold metallo-hydrolase [Pseudomonadota bacterium]
MKLKFWGTRGSSPRSVSHDSLVEMLVGLAQNEQLTNDTDKLRATLKGLARPLTYGGNTTCIEIKHNSGSFIIDLGTGLVDYGRQIGERSRHHKVFLTHLHWDHVIGLPFFSPLYEHGSVVDIYHVHSYAAKHLELLFNGINFPVLWQNIEAEINFHQLATRTLVEVDGVAITPFTLDHPGHAYGYRFDVDGKSVAVALDTKLDRSTPEELGKDLVCYQNLDYLIFDSHYEPHELEKHYDWGHSSPARGIDLAFRENISNIVLVHHSPDAVDSDIHRKCEDAVTYADKIAASNGHNSSLRVLAGYDGLEITI